MNSGYFVKCGVYEKDETVVICEYYNEITTVMGRFIDSNCDSLMIKEVYLLLMEFALHECIDFYFKYV